MTQPPWRPPSHLLLRPKAATTTRSTPLEALVTRSTPPPSRTSSQTRQPSPLQPSPPTDVSNKATSALIRRVLVTHSHGGIIDSKPIDELLPPLTSSNDVDLQLYAIIAIVIKEFVASWYGKITPDQSFVEEVMRIIAHCTRALEQRIRSLDVESLVLDEIPEFVQSHITAFRASHESLHLPPIATCPAVLYHALIPHPALSPVPDPNVPSTMDEQSRNEAAYRQLLVQGILAVLLPAEDLVNPCLQTLLADVIGEIILGNGVGGKACEGWLIWEGITKVVMNAKARVTPKTSGRETVFDERSRLELFGLLSEKDGESKQQMNRSWSPVVSKAFWRFLQYGYLIFTITRFIVVGFVTASSCASRSPAASHAANQDAIPAKEGAKARVSKRPILTFKIFSLISLILGLSERMPWLCGSCSLIQYHLINSLCGVGATDGLLDKFLHHLLTTHVLRLSLLPPLLLTVRTSIFPANHLSPPRPIPLPAQQAAIKRACAIEIISCIPCRARKRFLLGSSSAHRRDKTLGVEGQTGQAEPLIADNVEGTDVEDRDAMIKEVEAVLDIFCDSYCNKHLIYGILELVLVRLVPEIGEKGVRELMEERLGEGWEA